MKNENKMITTNDIPILSSEGGNASVVRNEDEQKLNKDLEKDEEPNHDPDIPSQVNDGQINLSKVPNSPNGSRPTISFNASRTHVNSAPSLVDSISSAFRNSYDRPSPPSPTKKIRLGICAMDKKARSKPMSEILSRLDEHLFEVIFFGDKTILHSPIEDWPICDVLIAFYSSGYPLRQAEAYAKLRKPFVLNDLPNQRTLMDRRRVYDLLESSGIDVPRHVYMSRDGYTSDTKNIEKKHETLEINEEEIKDDGEKTNKEDVLIEHDDHIEVNGVIIQKPFVEKPVDADDHNIAIYYPYSAGGGCKKLFRKIGDRSSEFYPDINEVRRDGSFIYEQFLETQGTDVKMYTVGPDYGHAEARKSPTVDGKVERCANGKEVRFPVILTMREKEIARRIVLVFKQQVCGFDLLRVQEGDSDSLVSYVCDVNGWSFVKNSRKYYDDCAQILTEHMLAAVKPMAWGGFSALDPLMKTMENPRVHTSPEKKRRPLFSLAKNLLQGDPDSSLKRQDSNNSEHLGHESFQSAATLRDGAIPVREIPDMLVNDHTSVSASSSLVGDDETCSTQTTINSVPRTHQEELRCIIAVVRHGDRTPKQKIKVKMSEPLVLKYFHKHSANCKKDLKIKDKRPMTEFLETVRLMITGKEHAIKEQTKKSDQLRIDKKILKSLFLMRDILERWKIGGLNRKLQIKPKQWEEFSNEDGETSLRSTEILLILKWGGNLTKLGERQSIALGKRLRHEMYPDSPGGGILRLHSTFRHDLKIKTSDEGRVMKTAASYAKGLLELEGEIPPILVSLVHKEKDSLHMLDPSGNKEVKKELEACKLKVDKKLQQDFDYDSTSTIEHENLVGPSMVTSLHKALKAVGNPRKTLFSIWHTIFELLEQLDDMLDMLASDMEIRHVGGEGLKGEGNEEEALCGIKLYKGETLLELTERWRLLHKKLYDEDADLFDLSRVPDVHDNVRFDMLHNPHLGLTKTLEKLYTLAKLMADCVVPQEYGTTIAEKISIGNKMCRALLEKIKYDLIIARTDNQVDMRYMINMDYSADLPINTMGRRIRTRLYFTSESHLHTLINVLRFSSNKNEKDCPLSKRGTDIIGQAPEFCYLTQVIIRLFEDTAKKESDPKRFRIEILFSPGASATPLHMPTLDRDFDNKRIVTEALQVVSKNNLTCQEVEDYFTSSIDEGRTDEDDDAMSNISRTIIDRKSKDAVMKKEKFENTKDTERLTDCSVSYLNQTTMTESESNLQQGIESRKQSKLEKGKFETITEEKNNKILASNIDLERKDISDKGCINIDESNASSDTHKEDEEDKVSKMATFFAKEYLWSSVAVVSFAMGVLCIFLSRSSTDIKRKNHWR